MEKKEKKDEIKKSLKLISKNMNATKKLMVDSINQIVL